MVHKNQIIRVDPIRSKSDIEKIKNMLADNPRNQLIFILGCNTNLRASDLVRIEYKHVQNLSAGGSFLLRERKTLKFRRITLNAGTHSYVRKYLDLVKPKRNDYLFRSQKLSHLQVETLSRMVKKWCSAAGLVGNFASHSLRKTWGYQAWKAGYDLPRLMAIFNHSSQKQTLDYLCIQDPDLEEVYLNLEL